MLVDIILDGILAGAIIVFCTTGEGVLFALSLGRRKPNWMVPWEGEGTMSHVLKEPSFYLGLGIWLGGIVVIGMAL